jgi:signal transduction histidine kinase
MGCPDFFRCAFGLTGIAHRARMLGGTYDFCFGDGGSVLRLTAESEGDRE